MKFKTPEVQRRWNDGHVHGILQSLVKFAEDYILQTFHFEPTMTESSRTRAETIAIYNDPNAPVSNHETAPLRAADLRSSDFSPEQLSQFVDYINARWIYDPARPTKKCCLCHEVGGHGWHLHLQVCEKTIYQPAVAEVA